jgi:hypothetical protein
LGIETICAQPAFEVEDRVYPMEKAVELRIASVAGQVGDTFVCALPALDTEFYLPADQPADGRSFVPLLAGKPQPERAIFWHYPLYLQGQGYNQVVPLHGTNEMHWRAAPCSVIRKGDWKLIQFFESDSAQLYNLKDDIGERKDLAKSHPEKTSELLKQLKAWQANTKAPIPDTLNPDFRPASKSEAPEKKKKKKRAKENK